jgi:Fe-Mn family superoxide dismutase
MIYQEHQFDLPTLADISAESVTAHLALYAGYVKNFNAITALTGDLMADSGKNAHAIAELMRRRSFEFGGMRLHELYFGQWEGAATPMTAGGTLEAAIKAQYGNPEYLLMEVRHVAMMRGPGWSLLYWDPVVGQFLVGFSGEQHQGHFAGLPIVLALDVWEHAYLLDYGSAGKEKYINAFFKNLNWSVVEHRYSHIISPQAV